jgi:manganese/zinc/iron transport system permease protein
MNIQLELMIIASLAAVACVLPGVFLVLRGVALMSDAISHAVLFGIVIMFLVVQNIESPLLIVGAVLSGLLTVFCTERLIQSHSIQKDAAIGLVFPFLFSIGVILVSRYARTVHLDVDMILLGELVYAPFNRLTINGIDIGPYALWLLAIIVTLNSIFIAVFYKELIVTTFDPDVAKTLGFSQQKIYYALMTITSLTAVAAFDIVGSIVVVALMITPAATAYLMAQSVSSMIFLSIMIGFLSAISGYWSAHILDVSIAGSIAVTTGVFFLCAFLWHCLHNKMQKHQS